MKRHSPFTFITSSGTRNGRIMAHLTSVIQGLSLPTKQKVLSGARQLQAASLSDEGIPRFRLGETWHTTACNSAPNLLHAFTSRSPRGALLNSQSRKHHGAIINREFPCCSGHHSPLLRLALSRVRVGQLVLDPECQGRHCPSGSRPAPETGPTIFLS